MNKYIYIAGLVVGFIGLGYIYFLQTSIKSLRKDKAELEVSLAQSKSDLEASRNQVVALVERENKTKQLGDQYEKTIRELEGKKDGPVADVLRSAVNAVIVRP